MKITKQRLKEIIKEELSGLGESDKGDYEWGNNPANPSRPADADSAAGYPNRTVQLTDIATRLGGPKFASDISQAIASAAGGLNTDQALGLMIQALESLLPTEELSDDDVEYADDSEALEFPELKHDPLGDSPAAVRMRNIARGE